MGIVEDRPWRPGPRASLSPASQRSGRRVTRARGSGAAALGVRQEPPPPSCPRPPAGHLLLLLSCLERQWLPKSKMAPLGVDETIDKLKMMEGRSSSIRKAVRVAFDRAMNHLSRVHGEPASDLSDID